MLQLFEIPLYQDYVFKGQGKLHELNGSLFNTLWASDTDLRLRITTVQDG